MRKNCIINPNLIRAITELKHTEYFVVCDPGLPVPPGVNTIDLSLSSGVPGFIETLTVICDELEVESYIIASEMADQSSELHSKLKALLGQLPSSLVSHEEFKELSRQAKTFVITGEGTPYANIILIGGVSF